MTHRNAIATIAIAAILLALLLIAIGKFSAPLPKSTPLAVKPPAACTGSDDTALIRDALASSAQVTIPARQVCALDDLQIPTNATILCESGATLLKVGSTDHTLFSIKSAKAVRVSGCTIDGASQGITNQREDLIYLQSSEASFDALTIRNVGAAGHYTDVFRAYDSSFSLANSSATENVFGSVATIDPNKKITNRIRIKDNVFRGMGKSAIWIGNSGSGIWSGDVEVAGNTITDCTDAGHAQTGTGEQGNAVQLWQTEFGDVHDNLLRNNRFAGVRLAKTRHVSVHGNTLDGNQETSLYCSELGGSGNHCWGNLIIHFSTGISAVNQEQRAYKSEPDVVESNILRDGILMGIALQGSIALNNIIDNVPLGIRVGIGSSYGHLVRGNTCLTSDAQGVPMISCIQVQTGQTQGMDVLDANQSRAVTAIAGATIAGNFGMWNRISNISNEPRAVVTYAGGQQPKPLETVCFYGVHGMPISGRCAKVVTSSRGEYAVDLDTSAMGAFVVLDGGQDAYSSVLLDTGGNPRYALPATTVLRDMSLPLGYVQGLHDGSDFVVPNSTCVDGALSAGTAQSRVFKRDGVFVCQ